jgi:hypothetical protein
VFGSAGGGALAKTAGNALPIDLVAGLFVVTLISLARLPGLRGRTFAGAASG